MKNLFKIEMPSVIDGGIMKGIVDVLQRRGKIVTIQAQGVRGRKTDKTPTHKLVLIVGDPGGENE